MIALLLTGFLASTFPLAKATDSSFGKTTIGLSTNFATTNYMQGCNFTAPEDGTVTQIVFYAADATTCNVKTAIVYLGNLTILDNGIGANVLVTSTAGWWVSTFSTPPAISGGESYVLMIVPETNLNYFYCDALAGASRIDTSNSYSSPTDPTDASVDVYAYSIYANYTTEPVYYGEVSLTLEEPENEYVESENFEVDFEYIPLMVGNSSDSFVSADLYINDTLTNSNTQPIENGTTNKISHIFSYNGTYLWDILLFNSTGSVWSSNGNFTLTLGIYELPEPTPSPEPTAAPELTDEEQFGLGFLAVLIGCVVTGTMVYMAKKKH